MITYCSQLKSSCHQWYVVLIISLLLSFTSFGNNIVVMDQNGNPVWSKPQVTVTKPRSFSLDSLTFDNLPVKIQEYDGGAITVFVEQLNCTKAYYNEYTTEQFMDLDTLVIFVDCMLRNYYPLIRWNDFNQWVKDSTEYNWLGDFLKENNFDCGTEQICITVFSTRKINALQRRKILHRREQLATLFLITTDCIRFEFSCERYTTRDNDLFLPGTSITEEFIRTQNTQGMKVRASGFRTVGVIGRVWRNPNDS